MVKYRIEEAEYDDLVKSRDEFRQALKEVMDLIGAGVLVRNVTDDGSSDWAIRMLPLVSTLGRAQELLKSLKPQALCECGQPENSIRHSFSTASSVDSHEFKEAKP
jgi:hypothetical protein